MKKILVLLSILLIVISFALIGCKSSDEAIAGEAVRRAVEICNDKIDNNGNKLIDCADTSCATSSLCKNKEVCNDKKDNDADKKIDCQDIDCRTDSSCATATAPQEVNFAEPRLRDIVCAAISKTAGCSINTEEAKVITTIFTPYAGIEFYIRDISGLESLINLESLRLLNNQITSITPVSNLNKLRNLDLYNNRVVDLSSLSNLPALQTLNLGFNTFTELNYLCNSPNLWQVKLDRTLVRDFSYLSNCPALKQLFIVEAGISDISTLKDLKSLEELHLNNYAGLGEAQKNRISNISVLASLPNLLEVNLGYNQIEDITPLLSVPRLRKATLTNNPLNTAQACNISITLENRGVQLIPTRQQICAGG